MNSAPGQHHQRLRHPDQLLLARSGNRAVTNPIDPDTIYEFVGPGMPRHFYLDQLAATGYTGWYDQDGIPSPWPEDFCDPDSDWQPDAEAFTATNRIRRVAKPGHEVSANY